MKLNPLLNQVGGHEGVLSMGEENEIIVKPALPRELQFYEEAVLHPELQAWMPAYYGSLTLTRQLPVPVDADSSVAGDSGNIGPIIKALNGFAVKDMMPESTEETATTSETADAASGVDDECLCLENVSHGFSKPCVLDLKLGTQLYDDDAPEEKKARLAAVAANTTSAKLGIRPTGFHVYDHETGEFTKYSKAYGKALKEETILDGFRAYFAAKIGPKRMRLVIERLVNDLVDFLEVIKVQEVRMRSSSLLMMYEGDPEAFDEGLLIEQEKIAAVVSRAKAHLEGSEEEQNTRTGEDEDEDEDEDEFDDEDDEISQKVTDMRLIDFAHSTWTPEQGPDEGVILGVQSALSLFEKLLQVDYPEDS
ncbi:hypothetical protein BGW38_007728 [Lunasporangiospora selenospora]|uniref:Kinase n=1 Tax=Lunasporangiospora selenospora TaxID=979761 RepID=A0A9P6FZ17_9FUNG|nr:hypothetical protein BGW38_007728 [Lunasporangiospora selenospora]